MTSHAAAATPRLLTLSVRETRLIVDRILLTLGVPQGFGPAVRNLILTSQSLGLAGFVGLGDPDRLKALADSSTRLPQLQTPTSDAQLVIDAQGAHAWMALPGWADMLAVMARHAGLRTSRIHAVIEPAELACIVPLAARYGLTVKVHPDGSGATVDVLDCAESPALLADRDPLLMRALREGFCVSEALWWPLYEASKKALSPDSVTSRRHAGPTIVQDDGTIIGRPPADDDTDLSLLRRTS